MDPRIIEGTWEQVARRAREFAGRRIRVTVLDEPEAPVDPTPRERSLEEAYKRDLIASGLVSRLPSSLDAAEDEDDAPIAVPGEPVSETILRERR